MAQHESISRKVIAGVLIGIILAALGFLAKWLLPGLGTFLLTIWHWCVHLVSVPVWLLILLSVYAGTSLIRAYLRHRGRTRQKPERAGDSPDEPNWQDYTCDVFYEIVWRWSYANQGKLQLVPFCLKCDTQIHPEIGHIDALGEKTRYACDNDNCGNQVLLDGSHEQVVDRVTRQIQRKLRSPSEEWKTGIKTQGWRKR
jgi:hypothetical protein